MHRMASWIIHWIVPVHPINTSCVWQEKLKCQMLCHSFHLHLLREHLMIIPPSSSFAGSHGSHAWYIVHGYMVSVLYTTQEDLGDLYSCLQYCKLMLMIRSPWLSQPWPNPIGDGMKIESIFIMYTCTCH